ncbi:hypothetical protein O0555_14160 [Brevibacillus laterosporus]|uniref:hypothetical protein n=1 Tax=Brevibacillus laterosporus TaxID=1465 RepID=UPI0018CF66A1|nr:hypothetical protein [Brevibacillus laterosporus]MBG9798043.1 hypothetical protein [Brevibacillus laterosporus]MCR8938480.1 hypothetical protein [Brevibacillus laterosporus]MCZ0841120.1 hypothetical protein [Brevibacillus laterosporus]MCZ0844964.1 hypothetical protein [Brevibacillus laterosporus]MED1912287.1 hypothetical protein [Brevibacillus laterosporus]
MKKMIFSLTSLLVVMGIATGVYASTSQVTPDQTQKEFEQMRPWMKQMHPQMTDAQIKSMYESCHGQNGMHDRMMKNYTEQTPNR